MRKNTPNTKKPSKPKKKKLVPLPKLKSKLWIIFSEFIRVRDIVKDGYCICCTCGKPVLWNGTSSANAGHFFTRKGNPALLFVEENVHSQHRMCNRFQRNNITWDYTEFMIKKYGLDAIRKMALLRGKPFKFTRQWLEEKIAEYSEKVKILKQQKGIE